MVEYALQNILQPIGVSTYRVPGELPISFGKRCPSVEDLEGVVTKLRIERNLVREPARKSDSAKLNLQNMVLAIAIAKSFPKCV